MKIGKRYKKIAHLLFWLVITLVFLYDRRYLIQKAGLDHFAACVVVRLGLIISLVYLNLYYLIPAFFATRRRLLYFVLLLTSVLVYVTLQNLYDIYLYGYVIGDIESQSFFYTFPYNFITTCWYLLLTVALHLSLAWYEQKRIARDVHPVPVLPDNGKDNLSAKYVFLKSGTRQVKTELNAIIYVQGLKDYSVVVTDKNKIIVKGSLKIVEQQLSGMKKLIRVHKSYLVAREKIEVVKGNSIITGDHAIPVGRMYKKSLQAMLLK